MVFLHSNLELIIRAKDEAYINKLATKDDIVLLKEDIDLVRKDIINSEYKVILALVVLIPTIMKILEHYRF